MVATWPIFQKNNRLPVIMSAEGAECGLACIAMVARYFGHDVDLNALRQQAAFSLAGGTLRNLMQLADRFDLGARALRTEVEDLQHVRVPAILHWDLNHFVVLKAAMGRTIEIHDPALGYRRIQLRDASRHFTGVVLELEPRPGAVRRVIRQPVELKSLWSGLRGLVPATAQLLTLSLLLQLVALTLPFQLQLVIDDAIPQSDVNLLALIAIGFGGLVIVQASIELLRTWTLQVLLQLASYQVIGNLVRHLFRLRSEFFEKRHVGDIVSRMSSARVIQDTVLRGGVSSIIDSAMALIAGVVLFAYSPGLAAIVYFALLLNIVASFAAFPFIRQRTEESLAASAREQTSLMESIRAAITIRLLGREQEREAVWRNAYVQSINAGIRAGRWAISLHAFQALVTGLQTVLVIYLGSRMVIGGPGFSVGMLMAFLAFRQTFMDRGMALVGQLDQFRLVGLHLDRLADIVTAKPEIDEKHSSLLDVKGSIQVADLSFRYGAGDRLVLSGINLEVGAGEFVAITGRSGGGKTTLLKLILGLYAPTEGTIAFDGVEASPTVFRIWREHVGVVAQDDRMISGTLAENIAFFDPDLSMERVEQAARSAMVHDEIMQMPMRYLSLVGDMGSALSGGQKQRILLARALYRAPQILILDEGTANLDVETEEFLADMIAALPMTRIVVAHRPALLTRATRILRIDGGRLFSEGVGEAATRYA